MSVPQLGPPVHFHRCVGALHCQGSPTLLLLLNVCGVVVSWSHEQKEIWCIQRRGLNTAHRPCHTTPSTAVKHLCCSLLPASRGEELRYVGHLKQVSIHVKTFKEGCMRSVRFLAS